MWQEAKIKMRDGIELMAKVHENGSPCWIVVTHGVGEHKDRHSYMDDLFSADFNIIRYDLRGHGESGGPKAYVDSFQDYMKDLDEIISYIRSEFKAKDYILFGHSMGALITANYLQNYAKDDFYPKLTYISAPPIGTSGALGTALKYTSNVFFKAFKSIPASLRVKGLVDLKNLSHEKKVYHDYINDPLNHLAVHTKLFLELIHCAKDTFGRPLRPKCPTYCSVGTGDIIVSYVAIVDYFKNVEKSVILKEYPEAFHEVHNEIEKYRAPYFSYLKEIFYTVRYNE